MRVAHLDDRVIVDLCDDHWRAVEVTAGGWRVVDRPPVYFTRKPGMAALSAPERGGTIDDLRPRSSTSNRSTFRWLLAGYWPRSTARSRTRCLVLQGEQGTGKSSLLPGLFLLGVKRQRGKAGLFHNVTTPVEGSKA
jgi:hypothetical protein